MLFNNHTPIPYHYNPKEMTVFDKACFGIIPDIGDHKSNERDTNGWSVAMILSHNGIEVP